MVSITNTGWQECGDWPLISMNEKLILFWRLTPRKITDSCKSTSVWRANRTVENNYLKIYLHFKMVILLMDKILHQLIGSLSHYLQGSIYIYISGGAGFRPSTVFHCHLGFRGCTLYIMKIKSIDVTWPNMAASPCSWDDCFIFRTRRASHEWMQLTSNGAVLWVHHDRQFELIPSRELTYPLPMHVWRWVSFSQGGIC